MINWTNLVRPTKLFFFLPVFLKVCICEFTFPRSGRSPGPSVHSSGLASGASLMYLLRGRLLDVACGGRGMVCQVFWRIQRSTRVKISTCQIQKMKQTRAKHGLRMRPKTKSLEHVMGCRTPLLSTGLLLFCAVKCDACR